MELHAEIKPAQQSDLSAILEIQKECFLVEAEIYNDYTIQPLHQTIDDILHEFTFVKFYKLVLGSHIIGSVRGYKDGTTCNVGKLIVKPEFQNRGFGKKLLLHIEDCFPDCVKFVLFTGFMSFKNLYLYEKVGYKEFDRQAVNTHFSLVFLEKIRADRMVKTNVAIIAGASGLVGSELLTLLLNDDYFAKVVAIVRTPLDLTHPKLKQKVIDFNNLQISMSGISATHAFCCLGTTLNKAGGQAEQYRVDHDYIIEFALACKNAGIENFAVVSSLGARRTSSNFYLRTKGEMEEDIEQIMFKHLVITRPSLLLGNRNEFRFWEKTGKYLDSLLGFILIGKLRKYKAVGASRVAMAMLSTLKREEKGLKIIESDKIQTFK